MGLFYEVKDMLSFSQENDGQTLYFRDGQLFKISDNADDWYDPNYIVSDGIKYSLSDPLSISKIHTPSFIAYDPLNKYGTTGMLDYVLRMKSSRCYKRKEKELCSSLLWKSTELMFANRNCCWRQSDYERLIYWHHKLGMYEEANKAIRYLESNGFIIIIPDSNPPKINKSKSHKPKITYSEQELAVVNMTTDAHMQQLTGFPFVWNQKIQKFIRPHAHPFCYMNIVGSNIAAIQNELTNLNLQIISDCQKHNLPLSLFIPVTNLVFTEQDHQGHTKFLCTPITIDGEFSDYPLTIFFTTPNYYHTSDSSIPVRSTNTTHGEVIYGIDGIMKKAKVYFWREGKHWFFYYNTINGSFCLTKIEKSPSG